MTRAVGAVIFMAENDAAVMGMRGTFSGRLASVVSICCYSGGKLCAGCWNAEDWWSGFYKKCCMSII